MSAVLSDGARWVGGRREWRVISGSTADADDGAECGRFEFCGRSGLLLVVGVRSPHLLLIRPRRPNPGGRTYGSSTLARMSRPRFCVLARASGWRSRRCRCPGRGCVGPSRRRRIERFSGRWAATPVIVWAGGCGRELGSWKRWIGGEGPMLGIAVLAVVEQQRLEVDRWQGAVGPIAVVMVVPLGV